MAVKTYQDSKDKYLKEKVDTFVLRVPKGKKDEIMEYAKSKGMSLNGYITELIFADMGTPVAPKAEKPAKKADTPKAEKKPAPKKPAPKAPKNKIKPAPEPVKEIEIVETTPEVQETEVKKKKMPSFLL